MPLRKITAGLKRHFSPITRDEALEKKEFYSKFYFISCSVSLLYTVFLFCHNFDKPREKSAGLFPDSWRQFFKKLPFTIMTVPELEERERKRKRLKDLNLEEIARNESNSNTDQQQK